ncbi:MAG: hypothetical protein H6734_27895 [Alphaproteobacteria bacterium]|nr:hypothetical protein [Alphaproteobacteria bacterium]
MTRRALAPVLLLVGALALVAAYLPLLSVLGGGRDDLIWIAQASAASDQGWHWALWDKQFVGYRPVCGLSFWLSSLVVGPDHWLYRATDLALLVGLVFGIDAAVRALQPTGRRWEAALCGLLALAHPATSMIAAFSARRSYTLGLLLGTLATASITRPGAAAWVGATLLAILALLSNEGAAPLVACLPVAAWLARPDRDTVVRAGGALGVAVLTVALLRRVVMGDTVGIPEIVDRRDALHDLVQALVGSSGSAWTAAAGGSFLALRLVPGQVRAGRGAAAWATAWVLADLALVFGMSTFEDRMAFLVSVPVAVVLGSTAGWLVTRWREGFGPLEAAGAVGLLGALAPLVAFSGSIHGAGTHQVRKWSRMTALVEDVASGLGTLPEGALAYLVVPGAGEDRDPLKVTAWVAAIERDRGRHAVPWVLYDPKLPPPRLGADGLVLQHGVAVRVSKNAERQGTGLSMNPGQLSVWGELAPRTLPWPSGEHAWVYVHADRALSEVR